MLGMINTVERVMKYIRHYRYNKLACLSCWLPGVQRKVLILLCMLVAVLSTAFACNGNSTNIFFPVQRVGLSQMDGLLEGKLELDNGCLRVKYFDGSDLLIWPHGFSLRTEGEEIQVIDSGGQVAARVGDNILVGGGEVPAEFDEFIAEEIIGQSLPDNCTGPYWIVSEVITD